MMNLYIKILPILCLFILTGCAPNLQSSEIKADKISQENMAIVITRIYAPYKNYYGRIADTKVSSIWERYEPTQTAEHKIHYNLSQSRQVSDFDAFGMHDHMIEPGTYFFKKLTFERDFTHTTMFYTITSPPDQAVVFHANAGEVVYIGDIKVTESNGSATVMVEDHYDDAVKYFKENRPEIHKPIQKRLVVGFSHIMLKEFKKALDQMNNDAGNKTISP
jgi:hypothetical protein